jgi:hypothetical protein
MCNRSLRSSALALAGILITIGGCSESPSAVSSRQFVARSVSARFSVSGSSASVIDARGGTLVTAAGDRIVFPAGALSAPTLITITSSSSQVGVELEPHGLKFSAAHAPVLILNIADSNAASFGRLDVSYVDESGNVAEVLPAAEGATTLTTTLRHFSGYTASGT